MTDAKPEAFTIRAYTAQHLAQFIRLGNGQAQLCEIEPKPIHIVTAEASGQPEEVIGTFPTLEAATEAAKALDAQMKAIVATDGTGPKLASIDGVTIQ